MSTESKQVPSSPHTWSVKSRRRTLDPAVTTELGFRQRTVCTITTNANTVHHNQTTWRHTTQTSHSPSILFIDNHSLAHNIPLRLNSTIIKPRDKKQSEPAVLQKTATRQKHPCRNAIRARDRSKKKLVTTRVELATLAYQG